MASPSDMITFFAKSVSTSKPLLLEQSDEDSIESVLRISTVSVGHDAKDGKTTLFVSVDKSAPVVLCTLSNSVPTVHVDLLFNVAQAIEFSAKGVNTLHLAGYSQMVDDGMGDGLDFGDEDGGDEDDDDILSLGSEYAGTEEEEESPEEEEDSEEEAKRSTGVNKTPVPNSNKRKDEVEASANKKPKTVDTPAKVQNNTPAKTQQNNNTPAKLQQNNTPAKNNNTPNNKPSNNNHQSNNKNKFTPKK